MCSDEFVDGGVRSDDELENCRDENDCETIGRYRKMKTPRRFLTTGQL